MRELGAGHSSRGNLTERSLALDQTLGARVIPQATTKCSCVDEGADWDPDNFLFLLESGGDATDYASIMATDSCGGVIENVSDDFTTWTSSDPEVATVAAKKVTEVGVGTATATAEGYMLVQDGTGTCDYVADYVEAPVTVISFKVTGKSYIFVGTDPNELYGNHYTATDSTGTQNPQPPGGTCCADSSDPSDTISQTSSNPTIFQFESLDQSTTVGDRTLTFEYDLPDGSGESQQTNVTAREFAYATNNSPSNACTLGYGTNQTYTYTVYTHPDRAAVVSTDGLSGTAVSESFSAPPCGSETGDGALNSNGQFADDLVDCSNLPLTCSKTVTQTLKVAGYQVRTNTVTYSGNGAGYTSNGPSQ